MARLAARSHLDGVFWSESHAPSAGKAADVRDTTLGHDLQVVGYASSWYVGRGSFAEVVDAASALGAPTIRLGATGLACGSDRAVALGELRRALDLAEAAGIAVCVSYLRGALDAALALVREANRPDLGLYWRAPLALEDEGLPPSLRNLRFYVPDVRADELSAGRRLANDAQGRFAVFDRVGHGHTGDVRGRPMDELSLPAR